jgi:hypothetical protein
MKAVLLFGGVVVCAVIANRGATFPNGWLAPWNHWDAPHYVDIARDGYVTTDVHTANQPAWIVYYPLYPWLIRAIHVVVRDYVASAQFISLIAAVAAALLMQRLAALDFEASVAQNSAIFMLIFPTAYFFHAGYSESLFIALTLACVLAARRRRWALSAAAGALASLTRINGLFLLPVMALEALDEYRSGRRVQRAWLFIPLAASGFLVYLAINYVVWGDAFHFRDVLEVVWGKHLTWPWLGVSRSLIFASTLDAAHSQLAGTQELLFVAIGLVCTVAAWKRLRPSYAVWMTLNMLLITSTSVVQSTPRYLLSAFPMFMLFALVAAKDRVAGKALAACSLIFYSIFATFFALGIWAF